MKKRILLLLLTMALALSFTLAACGDKTQGASPDSATSDSAAKDSSVAASNTATSSVASQADDQDNATPAPAADNNSDSGNNSNYSGNNGGSNNAQEEKSTPAPANNNNNNNDNASSQQSSSKASSQSSSKASSGNPAYKEGEEPSYTIAMTNKSTKKTYSVGCSFSKDDDKLVSMTIFLPGGEYDIAVYEYTEEKEKGDPMATGTYKNDIKETERKSVRVTYNTETDKITVEEMKSDRTQ